MEGTPISNDKLKAIVGDLYLQVALLTDENEALRQRLAAQTEKETE